MMRNEYREVADRDPVEEMTVSDLVREFARRDSSGNWHWQAHKRHCDVVDELRRRGILDND